MYSILKAKSLAKSQREGQVKKTKLSEGVELVQASIRDAGDGPASLSKWFSCFDFVVNTWAVVGCSDVQHDRQTRKYVHWSEVTAYMFEFQAKSTELKDKHCQDKKIFHYLSAVEEDFRAKAVEMARGESETPWGEALKLASRNHAHIWQERRDILEARSYNNGGNNMQASPKASSYKLSANNQNPPCRNFNNRGNCTAQGCDFPYVCSKLLSSGAICGARDHGAKNHDEPRHGKSRASPNFGRRGRGKGKGKGRG
jgi:hypothetical protein